MGGAMTSSSTNLHFHGLSVPAVCHQDETLKTLIQPGDPAFEYRIEIPKTQPPGLYWYHPHVHGHTEEQILGGASGAIIVEGVDRVVPRVSALPERVFVVRDEKMPEQPSSSAPFDPNKPTKQLSINNIPIPYPEYPVPVMRMKPGERQFWRVLNASADTYLDLTLEFNGKRQNLNLVSLDGVPLHYGEVGSGEYSPQQSDIFVPPAGRAEFIVTGPPPGASGVLLTRSVFRGAGDDNGPTITVKNIAPGTRVGQDDVDPTRPLLSILTSPSASAQHVITPSRTNPDEFAKTPLSSVRPARKRKLYFSERLENPSDPSSGTLFFVTEDGKTPSIFEPDSTQPITVRQGEVEDWTIENRSLESHTFHTHQLHFMQVASQGTGWDEPTLRDTIDIPAWSGFGRYPSVTVRMDFRDPRIVGIFPFHCHILQHADGGMMGLIQVLPAESRRISHGVVNPKSISLGSPYRQQASDSSGLPAGARPLTESKVVNER